ncbi:MAG: recombinase RecT, partial [Myxococcales bacterium]|nr:recombinase RecT [Myxococcales bacterium]
ELLDQMLKAKTPERLDEVASVIGDRPDLEQRKDLNAKYEALRAEMPGA